MGSIDYHGTLNGNERLDNSQVPQKNGKVKKMQFVDLRSQIRREAIATCRQSFSAGVSDAFGYPRLPIRVELLLLADFKLFY